MCDSRNSIVPRSGAARAPAINSPLQFNTWLEFPTSQCVKLNVTSGDGIYTLGYTLGSQCVKINVTSGDGRYTLGYTLGYMLGYTLGSQYVKINVTSGDVRYKLGYTLGSRCMRLNATSGDGKYGSLAIMSVLNKMLDLVTVIPLSPIIT